MRLAKVSALMHSILFALISSSCRRDIVMIMMICDAGDNDGDDNVDDDEVDYVDDDEHLEGGESLKEPRLQARDLVPVQHSVNHYHYHYNSPYHYNPYNSPHHYPHNSSYNSPYNHHHGHLHVFVTSHVFLLNLLRLITFL